jgi:murein L,D-transpeptidase YcbB/YkuD
MKPRVFNHMDPKVGNPGIFARVFDYDPALPDTSVAAKKMTESDRLSFLVSSAPDTYIYKALLREMDKTTDADKRHQLAVNMERCRWQIEHPKDVKRQILVNIPAQQLWAIGVDSVLDMRICCGAVPTKTPLLHSAISYMQVNPEWVIPQNIVKTEVVHHAGDSAYFARNRYSIIDKESGDTLNVASVGSNALLSGKLRISQKGGVGNSLGRIVFRFPNDFSIYLHDTNNRSAFQRDRRTLSHGCVRVQKPFELASFLLSDVDEWTLESLRLSMDIPPVTDRGREWLHKHANAPHPYRLISYHAVKPHVPLYILYYTTFPNPKTGVIDYWPDLYGFDKVISKELKWISEGSSSR